MSGLSERDAHAISKAVRILSEAGYRVEKINQGQTADHGIQFKLDVEAPTKANFFEGQSEAVKAAAMEVPEFGMDGEPVDESEDGGLP